MSIPIRFYLLLFTLIFSSFLQAKQELRVGVGNFPPFFIQEGERGLFLDITKEVFKLLPEYELKFIFMSNSRLVEEINTGLRIDAACNIISGSKTKAYLSQPLFRYTDVAISKKENKFLINQVSDLQNKSISAYQGAVNLLGEEFKQMALANSGYSEDPYPSETTRLMAMGQKDVRIGDINIFLYDISNDIYTKRKQLNMSDFEIHRLWPDVFTHIAFKDESIRDKVNKAILEIKNNGTLERIYREYEAYQQLSPLKGQ